MASRVPPIPEGYASVTPYLIVHDGPAALAWYGEAFEAQEVFRIDMPDGKIGHAEFQMGNSRMMLADESPENLAQSPRAYGGSPVHLLYYVEGVDAVVERAIAAGARLVRPVEDKFYGDRSGTLEDPFGYLWTVATHVEDVDPEEMQRRSQAAHS